MRTRGEKIPIHARIITVADTFDAMTTTRPYRDALSPETAVEELERFAGEQFCPTVVGHFKEALAAGEVDMDPDDTILWAD